MDSMTDKAKQFLAEAQIDDLSKSHIIFEAIRIANGKKITLPVIDKAIAECGVFDRQSKAIRNQQV